ncbi:MAG: hypothetical protein JWO48_1010 [Bryobacterales bacterium]|nr:hypothetical protein [Bryobacterales bacterium]
MAQAITQIWPEFSRASFAECSLALISVGLRSSRIHLPSVTIHIKDSTMTSGLLKKGRGSVTCSKSGRTILKEP